MGVATVFVVVCIVVFVIKMLDDLSEQKCQNLEWLLASEFVGKYNSEVLGKIIEVPQQPA